MNTWALGPLAAGATRTFAWKVVPVKAGTHTVHFAVAAGLAGKAKATLASGGAVTAHVRRRDRPGAALTHVDPSTGKVAPGLVPGQPVARVDARAVA